MLDYRYVIVWLLGIFIADFIEQLKCGSDGTNFSEKGLFAAVNSKCAPASSDLSVPARSRDVMFFVGSVWTFPIYLTL